MFLKFSTLAQLDELRNTSSSNDKLMLLAKYRHNEEFMDILMFLLDPFFLTGISKKKIAKKFIPPTKHAMSFIEVLFYLKKNNTGRDEDISIVQSYLSRVEDEGEYEMLESIITKSYKLGITATSFNKVFGKNTIRQFKTQKAKSYKDESHKVEGEDFTLSIKEDGTGIYLIKDVDGSIVFMTRQGKEVTGLTELTVDAEKLVNGFVYCGEVVAYNTQNMNRSELFRYTQAILKRDGEKTGVRFSLYDCVDSEQFFNGESKDTYSARMETLSSILANANCVHLHKTPVVYRGSNTSVVDEWLDKVIEEDLEGLMLNLSNALYECKKTHNVLKVKKFYTCDLEIIDFEEGENKNKGKTGAIIVDYKGNRVGIGALSDELRNDTWRNPVKYLGRIVEVSYAAVTQNQDKPGMYSLQFPTFVRFRDDKTKEDVSYD